MLKKAWLIQMVVVWCSLKCRLVCLRCVSVMFDKLESQIRIEWYEQQLIKAFCHWDHYVDINDWVSFASESLLVAKSRITSWNTILSMFWPSIYTVKFIIKINPISIISISIISISIISISIISISITSISITSIYKQKIKTYTKTNLLLTFS